MKQIYDQQYLILTHAEEKVHSLKAMICQHQRTNCSVEVRQNLPEVADSYKDGGQKMVFFISLDKNANEAFETLTTIRKKLPSAICIALVSENQSNLAWRALKEGASDYLILGKFDRQQLFRTIKQALKGNKLEQIVKLTEQKLRALIDHNIDPILIHDTTSRISFASPAIKKLLGYDPVEIIGSLASSYVHPDDFKMGATEYRKLLSGDSKQIRIRERVRNIEGNYLWIEASVVDCRKVEGINGFVCNFRSVDEEKQALLALDQKRQRLRRAMKIANMGYWWVNMDSYELHWSNEVYELFRIPSDSPISYDIFLKVIHPDDRDLFSRNVLQIMQNQTEPREIEYRVIFDDGDVRWFRETSQRLVADQDSPEIIEGIVQDITRQKMAEEQKNNLLRSLQERIKEQNCLFSILNIRNKTTSISELLQRTLGIIPQGFQIPRLTNLRITYGELTFHTPDFDQTNCIIHATCKTNQGISLKLEVSFKREQGTHNGQVLPEETRLTNLITELLAGMINEQYAVQELASKERYLRSILNNSLAAVLIVNDDGDFVDVNEAASELFGIASGKLLSMNISDIKTKDDRDVRKKFQEFILSGKEKGEFSFMDSNGQLKSVLYHASRIKKDLNLSILLDNTLNKTLHEASKKQLKAIERQNHKLRKIAWTQSHVVRAPLARVLGIMDLLQNYSLQPEEKNDLMDKLTFSVKEMDEVIHDLVKTASEINLDSV